MTTTAADEQPGAPRESLLARYPLLFYFLIAYAGTWLVLLPVVLSEQGAGLLPFRLSPLLGGLVGAVNTFVGPTLSAFVMTGITEGRAGIRRLLRRYVLWRVGLRWYLFALVGIPAIEVLGAIVVPGGLASFQTIDPPYVLTYLASFVVIFLIGGPLGEEPGWRGFALPRLQRLHGPLVGSLILGPLWGLWHLPLFWIPVWGTPPTILNIVLFILSTIALAIVFTWVFNNTKGSLLLAMLVHASVDAFGAGPLVRLFPAPIVTSDYGGLVPVVIGFGAVALVLVALTRGRLGYQHYRQAEEPDSATAPT